MELDQAELFSIFKNSPLLSESTKLIAESKSGITLGEIADRLHKKSPTVHRAIQRLRTLSLVSVTRKGRTARYQILPNKKDVVRQILFDVYHPTKSFVIGELVHPPFNAKVKQKAKVKGMTFEHTVDIVYESLDRNRNTSSRIALDVLTNLADADIHHVAGKFLDILAEIDGYFVLVVEDGCSRESYSRLDRLLKRMREKIGPNTAIFIERRAPLKGIKEALDSVGTAIEVYDDVKSFARQKLSEDTEQTRKSVREGRTA